jgi:hypothetical protein
MADQAAAHPGVAKGIFWGFVGVNKVQAKFKQV